MSRMTQIYFLIAFLKLTPSDPPLALSNSYQEASPKCGQAIDLDPWNIRVNLNSLCPL